MTILLDLFNAPALPALASTRDFVTKTGEHAASVCEALQTPSADPAECVRRCVRDVSGHIHR
jgi:hypothetical protein